MPEQNWDPHKKHEETIKTGMENSTGNEKKKKQRKQARIILKERLWNRREDGTGNMGKNNSTTWGNEPESSGQRRKIKEISTKGKTIQTKQAIPKQRKKILSTTGGGCNTKTYQQLGIK